MLKRKLKQQTEALNCITAPKLCGLEQAQARDYSEDEETLVTSALFSKPLWQSFYEIECTLNNALEQLEKPTGIDCIYNPVVYAADIHCSYLMRFLSGRKRLVFIGMNPGPNGMGQTGVPFGNVGTVRDIMLLSGDVAQPPVLHPKRPVNGMKCKTEEPSGVRLWNLFLQLAGGSLETFSQQCFVHNFCPLAFFSADGKNVTPSEIKGNVKLKIRDLCLNAFDAQLALIQPEIVVAVGNYVYTALKKSEYCRQIRVLCLPHPSPRSLNNHNWPEKASTFIEAQELLKYFRNEI